MKNYFKWFFLCVVVFCSFLFVFSKSFEDIWSSMWTTASSAKSTSSNNNTTTHTTKPTTYSAELRGAYDYAYGIGITTQTSIDNADMYWTLIRSHMAKMMANYTTEVLGKTPDTSLTCNFTDIANQTTEMQGYIIEACQLGLMGAGITEFDPDGVVNRAQFGTVLSRALYGDTYNGGSTWYSDHLTALKNAGIMSNISTPYASEVRGYVMLMLMRAAGYTPTTLPATCDTAENQLSCSLGLNTCPAECQTTNNTTNNSSYFSWKLVWPKWNYELYIPSWTWKRTYNSTDADYEFWDWNTLVQIRSDTYTAYDKWTLVSVVQAQVNSDKGRFRNYKQLENTTETIWGKTFGLIEFQAKSHNTTDTWVFLWFEKIYKDWDLYVYLYISTYLDTVQNTINSILDSLEITNANKNCNPDTEHKESWICTENIRSCSANNWEGTQTWNGNSRWSCVVTSCDYWFAMQYNSCVNNTESCYIYNWTWQKTLSDWIWWSCSVVACNDWYVQSWNACVIYVPTCSSDQHLYNNTCVSNMQACTITYWIWQQIWNGSYWWSCTIISCNAWYSASNNACYTTQSRSCTITHGVWIQTWVNNVYGTCTVASCSSWYIQSWNTCIVYVPTCTSDQHLENNTCISNTKSCTITYWIWQQTRNTSRWSCLVSSCNAGYAVYGNACYISQSRSCVISNGVWTQTGVNNIYGICTVVSCSSWYIQSWNTCAVYVPTCNIDQHLNGNVCTSNTMTCTISNWVWQQLWAWWLWGSCTLVSCNSWYVLSWSVCNSP